MGCESLSVERGHDLVARADAAGEAVTAVFCAGCELLTDALSQAGGATDSIRVFREARKRLAPLVPVGQLPTSVEAVVRFVEIYREVLAEAKG
jgi:hypothetical protein